MARRNIIYKVRSRCYQLCSSLCTSCLFAFFFAQVSCWDRIKKKKKNNTPSWTLLGKSLSADEKDHVTRRWRHLCGFQCEFLSRKVSRKSFEWDRLSHTSPFSLLKHVIFLRCKPFFPACLGFITCHIINSKGRHVSVYGLILKHHYCRCCCLQTYCDSILLLLEFSAPRKKAVLLSRQTSNLAQRGPYVWI